MANPVSIKADKMRPLVEPCMPVYSEAVIHVKEVECPLQKSAKEFCDRGESEDELRKDVKAQLEKTVIDELYRVEVLTQAQKVQNAKDAKEQHMQDKTVLVLESARRALHDKKKEAIAKKKKKQVTDIVESTKRAARAADEAAAGDVEQGKVDQVTAAIKSTQEIEDSIEHLIATRKKQLEEFYMAYQILLRRRELEGKGQLSESAVKDAENTVYHWLPIIQALADSRHSSLFKLMLLSKIVSTDMILGVAYWDAFKDGWVKFNFFRLLVLRIKRVSIALLEVLAATSELFKQIHEVFVQAYKVLSHLGYLTYFVRLCCHSIPKLVSACWEDGAKGLARIWREESLSVCNDVVWASVGIIGFFIAGTFPGMMLVVALYLFDVANILIHELGKKHRIKKELKKSDDNLEELAKFIGSDRLSKFERLKSVINQDVYKEKIAAASRTTREAVRLLIAKELVRENNLFDYDGKVSAALATYSKLDSDRAGCNTRLRDGMIESIGLFAGMAVTGVGVGLFASATALGLTGTATVATFTMAAVALSAVATAGLALIAAGAAFVICVCVYAFIKKFILNPRKSKMIKKRVKDRESKAGLTPLRPKIAKVRASSISMWNACNDDDHEKLVKRDDFDGLRSGTVSFA